MFNKEYDFIKFENTVIYCLNEITKKHHLFDGHTSQWINLNSNICQETDTSLHNILYINIYPALCVFSNLTLG